MTPRPSTPFFAFFVFSLVSLVLIAACVTSPTGRRQLMLFQDSEMDQMGVTAFAEIKTKTKATKDEKTARYVRCVANSITQIVDNTKKSSGGAWEVVVFEDDSANAFALPGRKIGVHTGLLKVATNQDQLAAVVGHEVAHVLSGHSNERLSTAYATETGLQVIAALSDSGSQGQSQIIALLGAGAQVGIILPFSRAQESEADVLGLDLMAKAGFDPRQSIDLWKNMAKAGGGQPIEFLSTHPSHETRMQTLEGELKRTVPLYEKARAQGRRPSCTR